ncbi:TetR/AcrR family transcriptional regulator [Longimicrobium sp.]|uniref:TetR/AcrR family transcriptional regulator n=1 Tax=Longimicrobium sp. TaxID=2029185 RepID=UPI002B6263F5|nr:TetR/AcrR family transcriptional regulator [Longimicrobium sp.]HSU17473.1 TetR/AcrR family transcriptional regulator [Longimicrobium sp.]
MKRERIESPAVETRAPGRPRSEEAHDAILGAAVALIREVGYDAVTMEGIAAKAGVGKATVYRRWKEKETLVIEAIGRIVAAIPIPDTGGAEGDLMALMRAALGMYADPASGLLLSGLVAAMARSERIAHAVRTGFDATWRAAVRQVLERAVARGELRAGLDIRLATDVIGGPLFYRYLMSGGPVDEPLAREIVSILLRAFAREGGG